MSEKQLTVAELMARAQKEGGAAKPARRRRRSIEEGGVSVAELTGSIPAVKSAPAQSKHGQPLDEPAPKQGAQAQPAPAAPKQPAKPAPAAQGGAAAPAKPAAPAAAKPEVKTPTKAEAKPAAPAPAQPAAPKVEPKPVTKPAAAPATPAAKPAAAAPAAPAAPSNPAAPKLVKKAPVTPPPGAPLPSAEETVVLNVVDADEPRARLTTDTPATGSTSTVEVSRPATGEMAAVKPTTGEMPAVAPVDDVLPPAVDDPAAEDHSSLEDEDEGRVSILALIGMVIVGLVLGAALFAGFEQLWLRLNSIIVAVLALAVTGGVVGVVHALRTEKDGMSMFLAGLAGLAMTFGPVLITGF